MKPLRLEAEGFTCYRERQEPLEFDGLSLFAIAGPTGAGKSSILDAMLFALYGVVPRLGKQQVVELIAQGRDAMAVVFDFRVRGSEYRVARRVKRRATGTLQSVAQLELLTAPPRPIADGVTAVNAEIRTLLGLDFDAFTQTVILPQGEFAKFLKAERKDQRAMLQHLLRHDIYQRMRDEAERRRAALDGELRDVGGQLQACSHATTEALHGLEAALEEARRHAAAVAASRSALDAIVRELRELRQATEDVHRLRHERAMLDGQSEAVAAARAELAAARRAAEIVPRLDAHEMATAAVARAAHEHDAAREADTGAQEGLGHAVSAAAQAAQDARRAGDLQARIRAIDEIAGDLERRRVVSAAHVRFSGAAPGLERGAAAAAEAARAAGESASLAQEELRQARAALDASGFDAAEYRRIEDAWPDVLQARTLDVERTRLGDRLARAEQASASAAQVLARAQRAVAGAERKVAQASAAADAARQALEAARAQHQAASLREHLHVGERCPVCLQDVVLLPPAGVVPELATLSAVADAARGRSDAAVAACEEARQQATAAAVRAEGAREARDDAARMAHESDARWSLLVAQLVQTLAGAEAGAFSPGVLGDVEARRAALRAARSAHDDAQRRVQRAEAAVNSADLRALQAQHEARDAARAAEQCLAELRQAGDELADIARRVAAVSSHDDPAVERRGLAEQVRQLEEASRTAEAALATARAQAAAAAEALQRTATMVERAREAAAAAQDLLDRVIADAGFGSVGEVREAVRDSARQAAIEAEVAGHERRQAAVLHRLLELEPRVAGREVSVEALEAEEARFATAVQAAREADLAAARLEGDRVRLAADVERRTGLAARQQALAARCALHADMAADLRGDAFQEFLLEEAFRALVAGASLRMRRMTNRYTLEWRDGAFFVVDHDNAGERRRAETLSGGETFMASLCLALQLSDEVLRTSGALQMDSLFIDEGFGTLDADTLNEVTEAMEALREDGGRMIGVISHRPELTERLPGCIRVLKGAGESRWIRERTG